MSDTTITETTRAELENALTMLASDVREYRTREQQALSDPSITVCELYRRLGAVTALKNVEGVIEQLAGLYKLDI